MRVDSNAFVFDANATSKVEMTINLSSQAQPGVTFSQDVGVFDASGKEHVLLATFTRTATPSTWTIDFTLTDGTITSPAGSVTMSFDTLGKLISPTTQQLNLAFSNDGGGSSTVAIDFSRTTQFASAFETFQINRNGNNKGIFDSFSIDKDGIVIGSFTNGRSRGLYKIPLTTVASPNQLSLRQSTHYALSDDSGSFTLREADKTAIGGFVPASLEQSNVDLSHEFEKMIETQRAFSSAGNALQVADEMIRVATDLKQ
jgi:flagellar hook protein FlgE